jgi:hypothetical protein
MTNYRSVLTETLVPRLSATVTDLGFVKSGKLAWRRGDLEVRVIVDTKAVDPFRGGAFTLEFERSDNGKFGEKLAGRVRLEQLLDRHQRAETLALRNAIATRVAGPDQQHLALIPESVRPEYLKAFQATDELEPRFWMRFRDGEDVGGWSALLQGFLAVLVSRAGTLDPHALLMGKPLAW